MKSILKEQELKDYFVKQEDVEFALLFGSFASGRVNPMSDIDIAVYFRDGNDALRLGDRQVEITCAVMSIYKVNRADVVVLNRANPFLRFQIMKYGRLLYARDEKIFYRFKANSFGIYQDIKPMYHLYEITAERSLRRGIYG
ncbi:MAG: nucleotidyltransferase domain-containing protein [Candidatus Omnitrophica bacterium]|nr:nucleotidyltransferase domain-containing protein [Candidatus Omnitrophota bacterium]MBU4468544.1 nucleotidyltransferase domain-containing protein [Candidatus Omnitrophota bacterium]MCG2707759.1 nucleotidyltransferase domain-containing protein [Candidatus Omnitrophota bacterium]